MSHLDRAYCHQSDSVLTIYQVRDMHFDEENDFSAKTAIFECVDGECDVELRGVNHTSIEFKNAPHFRLLKGCSHSDDCDFRQDKLTTPDTSDGIGERRDHKDSEYPSELLLERQPPPYGTGKPKKRRGPRRELGVVSGSSDGDSGYTAPHRTSTLEHIVETWLEHGKEGLVRVPLTIGDKTKWYPNAFKPIQYFATEKGLIYWGQVKEIRPYGDDYSITFVERPWFQDDKRQVGIYITGEQIDRYRKRRLFRRYIDSLLEAPDGHVRCYFVGAYPALKLEPVIPTG
ncbi:hypothetical protein [Candidatus Vondammii sp. HM_W22]|uniref:hypothetical protein n=1 Tax=Candidatus Vondammii sp. HM_W22 TaxID=2687299 RepID=UPI001F14581D|nr:hypothetical protein [Candidatus Vondammii sp. HM_W22]